MHKTFKMILHVSFLTFAMLEQKLIVKFILNLYFTILQLCSKSCFQYNEFFKNHETKRRTDRTTDYEAHSHITPFQNTSICTEMEKITHKSIKVLDY